MSDRQALEQRARLLGHSVLLALALLVIWALVFVWGLDLAWGLSRSWFAISRETLALVFYCGIGLFKLLAIALFLIPWLALRLEIRRLRRAA